MGLAHASAIQGHNPILAAKALAADRAEETRAIPTAVVPPGQESSFVRIEETVVAAMPRWALRKRRALEVALHGASTEAHLLRDGVQRPSLLMICPDLVIVGPPLGPPLAGQACRCSGRLWRGERHRGWLEGYPRTGRIVHRRGRGEAWGIDPRQLGRVGGEYLG